MASSEAIPGYADASPFQHFRAPLTAADIRDLHTRDPSPSCTAMAWEIARLRDLLLRVRETLLVLAQQRGTDMRTRVYLRRLADRLLAEPAVREELERLEMRDQSRHRAEYAGRHAKRDEST